MINEYKRYASICSQTDYEEKESVTSHNNAVDQMYRIVIEAAKIGPDSINELAELLDDKIAAPWLAHHLIEKTEIPKTLEGKCFEIIENIALGSDVDAMGEKQWLREWKNKKGRV